jgi:putative colanic acid biosynthesis glycosyltransferase
MKILHINTTLNSGSTGRIAENIGNYVISQGGKSVTAYGRNAKPSVSPAIKIGNKTDQAIHLLNTRIFDTHGFHSKRSTEHFLKKIIAFKPDIIHLHNLHGYYLNVEVLFKYLKEVNIPVIWTLHDCWAFTGHCCHYERVKCEKWKSECYDCPLLYLYPESKIFDNSRGNYHKKKEIFNSLSNLTIVTVSEWLASQVNQSFLQNHAIKTIYNGIDLNTFRPKDQQELKQRLGFGNQRVILGVANEWSSGKGLDKFLELSTRIDEQTVIILIGLSKEQLKELPPNIIGLQKTHNIEQLADYYSMADVFITPSIAETFGMVVAEAIASGTPCIVNNSSALPELVDDTIGCVVENTTDAYFQAVQKILGKGKNNYSAALKEKAKKFNISHQLQNYYSLYLSVLGKSSDA